MLNKTTRIGLLAPITWSIPPINYGPWEQDVADLAVELVKMGFNDITLYATKEAHIPGVKTVALLDKPLGGRDIPGSRALELLHISHSIKHAAQHVDILNSHLNYHPLLFSEFTKLPIVTTLHGAAIEDEARNGFLHYKNSPYISLTMAEQKLLPELNYIAAVPNGIDFSHFQLGTSPKNYLVNTGRMHPTKGVHNAIKLAQLLKIPLYLAGPIQEDFRWYFDEQIAPHVDNKQIFYLGNLTSEKVHELISNALAFVGLIEWDEAFGRSVAEAMACGTPVIGTPRGSHTELIIDGITGILTASPEEAAQRFNEIEDIDRKKCRDKAYEMFSLEVMGQGYVSAYEKVLQAINK